MFATIRRYEAIDQSRTGELVKKVDDEPRAPPEQAAGLRRLSPHRSRRRRHQLDRLLRHLGAGRRVDRVASTWLREEKLETALPNAPKITVGEVVVNKPRELVQA